MSRWLPILYDWFLWRLGATGESSRLAFALDDVPLFAIAIQRTSDCTTHAGLAFRDAGQLRFLHYANHNRLRNDRCLGTDQFALSIPSLKVEDLDYLVGFCSRVHRANSGGRLPYSFLFDPNIVFDEDTGLVTLNHESGLTCSTFVVTFFRSAGIPLVRVETWPRNANAADIAARSYLLSAWRKSMRQELIERADDIAPTIQVMRISPEQVAGACLQRHLPAGYFCARANGAFILRRIIETFGPPA